MTLVKVYVTYKKSILDPQGEAVKKAVHGMGFSDVHEIRMGKYFEITVDENSPKVKDDIEKICDGLLANPNMETYRYEFVESEAI
ncbi:phosphoribosylformylglycinamidine synthase subunit PurS [Companilactobacillus ginsenosidimutans]|uniref:Phosphoribosylformylglycinamidine synthase subunit PurS n=1 Tax=Companilactobacillus ginsenosidimutans TaxID=1007676 RepID=A0A0H4QE84_9LACO|nr:phosphoribosylformylglycinamidine synthase subunit PurS [Companilactobacillus ginsenosidimutans]AKP66684.1 phosphoribosylformylglycinamidine synthase [Companilactobacillus ginsenosidimutans]